MAGFVEDPDRLDLRQHVAGALQPARQALLLGPDLLGREVAQDLVGLGDGAVDGLEGLGRVLLDDVEGALDAVLRVLGDGAVVMDARVGEQERGCDEARDHHDAQRPEDASLGFGPKGAQ
jgi:hypothetical protein